MNTNKLVVWITLGIVSSILILTIVAIVNTPSYESVCKPVGVAVCESHNLTYQTTSGMNGHVWCVNEIGEAFKYEIFC